MARAVVATRHAYWSVLLDVRHLPEVLRVIEQRCKDPELGALAKTAYASDCSATIGDTRVQDLAAGLNRQGGEYGASEALVELASKRDPQWHRDATRARARFVAARNRFIAANLRLVILFAQRYGRNLTTLGDRIQDGNLGLMKAVDRFDPERGVRFSTYAGWWIRHTITRGVADGTRTVRVPPQIQQLVFKAERTRRRLRADLGREPELRELAIAVDCDPKRLSFALETMELRSISLDAPPGDASALTSADSLSDDASLAALEDVLDRRDRDHAVAALAVLSPRERDIVHERFAFPGATADTLAEIGRRHGISRERARQLQRVALDHLRRKLEPRPAFVPYAP